MHKVVCVCVCPSLRSFYRGSVTYASANCRRPIVGVGVVVDVVAVHPLQAIQTTGARVHRPRFSSGSCIKYRCGVPDTNTLTQTVARRQYIRVMCVRCVPAVSAGEICIRNIWPPVFAAGASGLRLSNASQPSRDEPIGERCASIESRALGHYRNIPHKLDGAFIDGTDTSRVRPRNNSDTHTHSRDYYAKICIYITSIKTLRRERRARISA